MPLRAAKGIVRAAADAGHLAKADDHAVYRDGQVQCGEAARAFSQRYEECVNQDITRQAEHAENVEGDIAEKRADTQGKHLHTETKAPDSVSSKT